MTMENMTAAAKLTKPNFWMDNFYIFKTSNNDIIVLTSKKYDGKLEK